jgi:DNA-binding NtrC family response regulator
MGSKSLNGRLNEIVDEMHRGGLSLSQARREFEKQFIVAALQSNQGNFSRSARCLGVHRNTLRNKLSDLGIMPADFDASRRSSKRR